MQHIRLICGVDEAGRGPLAGPVYAAAVILNSQHPIIGLADSKKISEKKLIGKTLSYDIRGNEYESNLYAIPKIQMGKVQIRTCPVEAEDPHFSCNANIWNPREESDYITSGRIGSKIAQKNPLLLDFNSSVFFLVRNRESLKKLAPEGYSVEALSEIPFFLAQRAKNLFFK